ncbi:MAG: Omp28-related outer membrane protein [Flavobacteriales bacterium]
MKKTLYYFLFLAGSTAMFAQTFVGTTVEKKKPLLEKFTGTNCGACPGGDNVIDGLKTTHGDDINVFAHHTFNTAPDDFFNVPLSEAIAAQSMATGYPAGSVNRIVFPHSGWSQNAGGSAMSSSNWGNAILEEIDKDAYVNIGAKLRHDVEYNKFFIDVEVYYTGNPATTDQRLNVVLVQNKVLGPQAGGGAGDNYEHNHMVREFVTGQWGEMLMETVSGKFIEKTYEVEIPDTYGKVPAIAENMEVVVFITEGQTTVANSTHALPDPFVNYSLNADIKKDGGSACGTEYTPSIKLTNYGTETLTSIEFEYTLNGITDEHTWTGSLNSLDNEVIDLPSITYTSLPTNNFTAEIISTNGGTDEAPYNNSFELEFDQSVETSSNTYLEIKLDGLGSQIEWEIVDEDKTVHYSGGPYADETIDIVQEWFSLSDDKCYSFEITDKGGNGLVGGQNASGTYYPAGYYKLQGTNLNRNRTTFGESDYQFFSIDMNSVSVNEFEIHQLEISPNPNTTNFVFNVALQSAGEIKYSVTNVLGSKVRGQVFGGTSGKNGITVDHNLEPGIYYLMVEAEGKISKGKFVVQ